MTPDLSTISSFAPKCSGFQSTRSATLPTSIDPTCVSIPWVIALEARQATSQNGRDARIDGVFGNVSLHATVVDVVGIAELGERTSQGPELARGSPGP